MDSTYLEGDNLYLNDVLKLELNNEYKEISKSLSFRINI